MEPITLYIVDDHEIVVHGLKAMLATYEDIKIVGSANEGYDALKEIPELKPDIVLLDLNLPDIHGVELCKELLANGCKSKIVFHTSVKSQDKIMECFANGASGYIYKSFSVNDILYALQKVWHNEKFISPQLNIQPEKTA